MNKQQKEKQNLSKRAKKEAERRKDALQVAFE